MKRLHGMAVTDEQYERMMELRKGKRAANREIERRLRAAERERAETIKRTRRYLTKMDPIMRMAIGG